MRVTGALLALAVAAGLSACTGGAPGNAIAVTGSVLWPNSPQVVCDALPNSDLDIQDDQQIVVGTAQLADPVYDQAGRCTQAMSVTPLPVRTSYVFNGPGITRVVTEQELRSGPLELRGNVDQVIGPDGRPLPTPTTTPTPTPTPTATPTPTPSPTPTPTPSPTVRPKPRPVPAPRVFVAPTLLQGTLRSCTNTYSGGTRTSTRGTVVWSFSGGSNWAPASGRIVGSTIVETFQTSYRYFTSDGTSVKDLVSGRTVALLTPRSTWTRYDFNAVCS